MPLFSLLIMAGTCLVPYLMQSIVFKEEISALRSINLKKKSCNTITKWYYHNEKSAETVLQTFKSMEVQEKKKSNEGLPPSVLAAIYPLSVMEHKSPTWPLICPTFNGNAVAKWCQLYQL